MDTIQPPNFLGRAIERLVRAFAPDHIVLFGSYAKGMVQPGSDVDLLIVADLEGDPVVHRRRARQLTADCFPRVDVILCSVEEVNQAATMLSPFLLSILRSGINIYCRPETNAGSPLTEDNDVHNALPNKSFA